MADAQATSERIPARAAAALERTLERLRRRHPGAAPLVFVGGTGRSGTHVVAKLLGRHPYYRNVPIECRFHCDPGGFPDLLAGRVTLDDFLRRLRDTWWREFKTRRFRGLHRIIPPERFDSAVSRFQADFDARPNEACRGLFFELLDPLAREVGKPGLVEQSCDTAAQAAALTDLFEDAKVIHVVRDGRDVASSRISQGRWLVYPRTWRQGIEWWERRLRRIDLAVKAAPPDRVLTVALEDLIAGTNVNVIREFVGVRPARAMRRYRRQRMSAERAHTARWRQGMSKRKAVRITARYEAALEGLEADGVQCAPLLRRIYEESR